MEVIKVHDLPGWFAGHNDIRVVLDFISGVIFLHLFYFEGSDHQNLCFFELVHIFQHFLGEVFAVVTVNAEYKDHCLLILFQVIFGDSVTINEA